MNRFRTLPALCKWYLYSFKVSVARIWPRFTLKVISRYSDQVLFRDASGFILSDTTANDLRYAVNNSGYFFDCHEIRDYLNLHRLKINLAIDVGANLGAVTYLLSKMSRSVISFEPSESTLIQLKKNIDLNQLDNVILEQYACSNHTGISDLFVNSYHGHSSLSERTGLQRSTKVRTIRLDEYLDSHSIISVDLLKIDVEGHELAVIEGLGKFLNPDLCKAIIWEHSLFADKSAQKSLKVYEMLYNAGYKISDLSGKLITTRELVEKNHLDVLATA